MAAFTSVGAFGFGTYHYINYQAKVRAKIDHPFGATFPKQQMPQEAKIDEELDTQECSTAGLVGLLQAHRKAVHDDFEEEYAAVNQKIQELKDEEDDESEERLSQELERLESEAKTKFLTRYFTSA